MVLFNLFEHEKQGEINIWADEASPPMDEASLPMDEASPIGQIEFIVKRLMYVITRLGSPVGSRPYP